MEANKSFNYTISLSSNEITALVVELSSMFKANPALAPKLKNVFGLSKRLTQLLGHHDYSPEKAEEYRAEVIQGLAQIGVAKLEDVNKQAEVKQEEPKKKRGRKKAQLKAVEETPTKKEESKN